MSKILVVDDEVSLRKSFKKILSDDGNIVTTASDYDQAQSAVDEEEFDLIISDILLGNRNGIELLKYVKDRGVNTPVVMITGHPNLKTAADSVRLGAFDYLSKPVQRSDLQRVVRVAIEHRQLIKQRDSLLKHLEAIFASVNEGIVTVDSELNILHANHSFGMIVGVEIDELIGRTFDDILSGSLDSMAIVLRKALQTGKPTGENRLELETARSENRILVYSASPLESHSSNSSEALLVIRDITRLSRLERVVQDRYKFRNIIGRSHLMQEIYGLLEDVAETDSTVLIMGETGTGKELVAAALHNESRRRDGPFVKVNCAALSENLLESELFGHVKGAFTGAIKDRIGRFQLAKHGTIFLDEIGDISQTMQTKLLRVLQEKAFERVGDSRTYVADVRIVAATNHNLMKKIEEGQFREDLYYRLNVIRIHIPPLRDRREDIPLLAEHFCKRLNYSMGKNIEGIDDATMDLLVKYAWPGNVRELENCIERAFIVCHGNRMETSHLPSELREKGQSNFAPAVSTTQPDPTISVESEVDSEEDSLLKALDRTDWNVAKTARLLGIARNTLYRKIRSLNLVRPTT